MYARNYSCVSILSPDFVKLADAHGIPGATVRSRAEVLPTVDAARRNSGPFLINFMVEKEDAVYPMVGPGAALDEMIRRPSNEPIPLIETSEEP
jgi:acetolactate synthase-1/2/3 large subunit